MRGVSWDCGTGRKPARLFLGWAVAVFIVAAAVFGPLLTGQSNPALGEIRHNVLMIDREFDRLATRADISRLPTPHLLALVSTRQTH
jgi:hypothetical protein